MAAAAGSRQGLRGRRGVWPAHGMLGIVCALGALTLVVAGCGGDDDGNLRDDGGMTEDRLVMGGPETCRRDPACLDGLQEVYGMDLSDGFVAMSSESVAGSLRGEAIDIGVIPANDPALAEDDELVVLEDDQQMVPEGTDANVFVMTTELSEELGITRLSDLANLG